MNAAAIVCYVLSVLAVLSFAGFFFAQRKNAEGIGIFCWFLTGVLLLSGFFCWASVGEDAASLAMTIVAIADLSLFALKFAVLLFGLAIS